MSFRSGEKGFGRTPATTAALDGAVCIADRQCACDIVRQQYKARNARRIPAG